MVYSRFCERLRCQRKQPISQPGRIQTPPQPVSTLRCLTCSAGLLWQHTQFQACPCYSGMYRFAECMHRWAEGIASVEIVNEGSVGIPKPIRCPAGFAAMREFTDSGMRNRRWEVADYVQAYNTHLVTPLDVAGSILERLKESEAAQPSMRFLVSQNAEDLLSQAEKATSRFSHCSMTVIDRQMQSIIMWYGSGMVD